MRIEINSSPSNLTSQSMVILICWSASCSNIYIW